MDTKTAREKHARHIFPGMITYYPEPLVLASGEGARVVDAEGKRYLDFFGGILTVSVGHCHPAITERIVAQLRKLQHVSTLYLTEPALELAELLARLTPGRLSKCYFTNSGTEADETAVLIARLFTGRQEVIALRHAYSGRSMLAMSLTAHAPWRALPSPVGGIKHAHSPYCYRCALGLSYPACDLRCARDLEELIQTETSGEIAAFMAEPVQGVGGFIVPPREYFQVAVEIARKHGGIFICDEVQTGFGRTGTRMFGIEHFGVEPEVMTMAKGIANGLPMGVTIAREDVAASLKSLTISTFGGNPVSSAAACATIEVIEKEQIPLRAATLGQRLRDGLEELARRHEVIGDVRGMGLMMALELVLDRKSKAPAPARASALLLRAREEGLLIGKGGLYGNVMRIAPPMLIGEAEVDEALAALDRALARC